MERRLFIKSALASPLAIGAQSAKAEDVSTLKSAICVDADGDRNNKPFHLPGSIGLIHCKVSTQDTNGGLFIIEHINMGKGGSVRHLHYDQDEWFYAIQGEYIAEVGDQKYRLKPGDSLFAPRKMPHVWAHVDDKPGRLLIAFQPAGKMEALFRLVSSLKERPPQEEYKKIFRAHGLELLGPPLRIG